MCGITGVIKTGNSCNPVDKNMMLDLASAMRVQKHRGPDDEGVCIFNFQEKTSKFRQSASDFCPTTKIDGALGFNRLSIKDLSATGRQPMSAINGQVIITFNGEIYNDNEIRDDLKKSGYTFEGTSDTEVILYLYLESGFNKMITLLNGMFAIVIVDLRKGLTFMARDRYGIKPLYYTFSKNTILFASEIKGLTQFRIVSKELDLNSFFARLAFSRPSDKIMLAGVNILQPGHYLVISESGGHKLEKYYCINDYNRRNSLSMDIDEALEETEMLLNKILKRQMVSDVNIGLQLSGGVDSSIVSYFARHNAKNNSLDALSIIDHTGQDGEEEYIDHVISALGIKSKKFTLTPDYFAENYERMIWHNDSPTYSQYFSCHFYLAERAKKFISVFLSGEGADELAGGYNRFSSGFYHELIKKINPYKSSIRKYDTYAEYAVMSDSTSAYLFSENTELFSNLLQNQINTFNNFSGSNLTKQIKFEISQRLPEGLMRQDKMNMAHSIENRVPFLDNEFVDFIMQLPEDLLLRFNGFSPTTLSENPFDWINGKFLIKELCARKFGYDFSFRKKHVMSLDRRNMLKGKKFSEIYEDKIHPGIKSRGIIDSKIIDNLYKNIDSITEEQLVCMWRAMTSETWCQLFLDTR